MFDELDDPAFPGAGAGAREAVAARAASIRRRRRAALAGGGTSLALVLATIVYATNGSSPRSLDVVTTSPSPSASETVPEEALSPEPTASAPASPEPSATATHPAEPAEPVSPRPTPEPTETETGFRWNQPDGKPGWSSGYGGCGQHSALPPPGTAPFEDLTLELRLPEGPIRGGQRYTAHAVITNTGDRYLRFSLMGTDDDAVLVDGRGNSNGSPWSDAVPMYPIELAPGASVEQPVQMTTYVCGDTSADPERPLPAGTYTVSAALHWSDRAVGAARSPDPSEPTAGTIVPTQEPSAEPTPEPSPSWGERADGFGSWATPRISVTVA